MDASRVMLLPYLIVTAGCKHNTHYVLSIIQCVNKLVDKYNEFSIIHNRQITLYFFHKSCPLESRVLPLIRVQNALIKFSYNIMWSELITQPIAWRVVLYSILDNKIYLRSLL